MREIKFRAFLTTEKRMMDWKELCDKTEDLQEYFDQTMSNVSPVMQFTGLKDKNGREIYEWDIIKTMDGIFSVEFREGGFFVLSCLLCAYPDCEIIGNFWETPELLEEKHE